MGKEWACLHMVLNLLSCKMQGICWLAKELIAFQKGLCSLVLVMYCHCLQISVIMFFFLIILSGSNSLKLHYFYIGWFKNCCAHMPKVMHMVLCECVCVCVWERERERERGGGDDKTTICLQSAVLLMVISLGAHQCCEICVPTGT